MKAHHQLNNDSEKKMSQTHQRRLKFSLWSRILLRSHRMMKKLRYDELTLLMDVVIVPDQKVVNVLCGLANHSSAHCCFLCTKRITVNKYPEKVDLVNHLKAIKMLQQNVFCATENHKKANHCVFNIDAIEKSIRYFTTTLRDYGKAMTPKQHMIIFHVLEFSTVTNHYIGDFSEQDIESLHRFFVDMWERYTREDI